MKDIAGIVLAGGLSSRMGRNKSLLEFHGVPLVEHMQKILQSAGIPDVYISGAVPGYESLPDAEPHRGPARAVGHLLKHFASEYRRCLFVPVDMPFMGPDIVQILVRSGGNAFIEGHPLPCCLATRNDVVLADSVKELLKKVSASALKKNNHHEKGFLNLNTPVEWEAAVAADCIF